MRTCLTCILGLLIFRVAATLMGAVVELTGDLAKVMVSKSTGMKLVLIPAATFEMGAPDNEPEADDDEKPRHRVRLTEPFYVGQYEVTQREYLTIMGANPSEFGGMQNEFAGQKTHAFPVENVSWFDAVEFCNKLSAADGLLPFYRLANLQRTDGSITMADVVIDGGIGFRLPTEAEWEFAARGDTATAFPFGAANNGTESNINGSIPYGTTSKGPNLQRPTAVGSYSPNGFRLYDMVGNVCEWCQDKSDQTIFSQRTGITENPLVTAGKEQALRGGAWNDKGCDSRSAFRDAELPGARSGQIGFRVVRTARGG